MHKQKLSSECILKSGKKLQSRDQLIPHIFLGAIENTCSNDVEELIAANIKKLLDWLNTLKIWTHEITHGMIKLEAYQELQIISILEDRAGRDHVEIPVCGHSQWLLLKRPLVLYMLQSPCWFFFKVIKKCHRHLHRHPCRDHLPGGGVSSASHGDAQPMASSHALVLLFAILPVIRSGMRRPC